MRDDLQKLIGRLQKADGNKETFRKLLLLSIKLLDLSDEEIAKRFNASHPTISRWRNGSNAPHAAYLSAVYEWLLGEACARLTRVERIEEQEAEMEAAE